MKYAKRIKISTFILVLFGILMIYSASCIWAEYKYNNPYYYLIRQILFAIIGIIIFIIVNKINIFFWYKNASIIFLLSLILLILVLIPGIGIVRGGARSWIGIGNFSIQPAEFIKIFFMILLSKYLSNYPKDIKSLKNLIFLGLLIGFITILIMLEPDLGTAIVFLLSIGILIIISGLPFKYFIIIILFSIVGFSFLIISEPYRINRIISFIDPWKDPLNTGFQTIQSLYALVPSGIFGLGLFKSKQKYFYLPEPQTDFIFAIIKEELGLIGVIFLLTLFFIIFYNGILISLKTKNLFLKYLALGIIILLFVQFFINISVVIGLLPVTGITLPFISYGGSSLLLNIFGISLLCKIGREEK